MGGVGHYMYVPFSQATITRFMISDVKCNEMELMEKLDKINVQGKEMVVNLSCYETEENSLVMPYNAKCNSLI